VLKERVLHPGGTVRVNERGFVEAQGRHVKGLSGLHLREELRVDGLVANPMRKDVRSRSKNRFRVVEIMDVGGDAESMLV
jgi:hypothetical protein